MKRSISAVLVAIAMSAGCSASPHDHSVVRWWTTLDEGDCFELDYAEGTEADLVTGATEVACSTPHEFEVFEVFQAADSQYPGHVALSELARASCGAAFADFVGRDRNSSELTIYWLYPNKHTWSEGDRLVTCSVFLKGEDLTGSQRNSGR